MFISLPKSTGIYSVKDNINNLQLKIHFRAINTLLKLPKCPASAHAKKNSIITGGIKQNTVLYEETCMLIKWQQKLFSSKECELYSDLKNCTNDQQIKYHEMLKESSRNTKQTKKKRRRKQTKMDTIKSTENFIFTYVHEDNFSPPCQSDIKRNIKHYVEEPFEEMFIYAALNPDTQLIALRWLDKERLLYIYPDFTDSYNLPYIIEIVSDYRHLYSYGIEDVSLKYLASLSEEGQYLCMPESPAYWRIEDELGTKFAMPPKLTQRCAIIFTINNLSGFQYDNIHVRYYIKLPRNTILEEGLLEATSHSSSSCFTNSSLNIGLTWQITVLCEEEFNPSEHLRIFFKVISIDSWERERIEGFSYYTLRLFQPCHHMVKLNCIRPVETLLERIQRYFIGGCRKFNYQGFVDEGTDEVGGVSDFQCRYGERMQNSGQLSLCCQVLTQRSCKLLNSYSNRTCGMTLDDIMMAYKEARRRLEAVALN